MPSFANGRGISHGGSNGQSLAFPDVCLTPTSGGPVPIPYPNLAQSLDTSAGPTTVSVEGQMPMVKGALYAKSTGDAPGSVGGVTSGTVMATCEFAMYSFDVKIEGKNACRLGDPLLHNNKNAPGGVEMGEAVTGPPPSPKPLAPAKSSFVGTLKGPAGPLKDWPFVLRRDGSPLDQGSLGGSSSNSFRKGAWVSGANGEFSFTNMPEGCYDMEVLLPTGKLQVDDTPAPPTANETGHRKDTHEELVRAACDEQPDEFVEELDPTRWR